MNKLTIWLLIICIVLISTILALGKITYKYYTHNQYLKQDITTLTSSIKYRDSLSIAEKGILQLDIKELKDNYTALTQTVKEMNIKLKNVTSISTTSTQIKDSVNIQWVVNSTTDTTKVTVGTYSDKWTDIVIIGDKMEYTVKDSLIQVISDSRNFWKKLLFWKPATYKQSIKCMNPNSTIKYMEYIQINK